MSQQSWGILYRISGIVLMFAILGLLLQGGKGLMLPIVVIAVASGLLCLLARSKKNGGTDATDFASMLQNAAAGGNQVNRVATTAAATHATVITGVVADIASPGFGRKFDVYFILNPWRTKGGTVQETNLAVHFPKPMSRSEYDRFATSLGPDDVIVEIRTEAIAAAEEDDIAHSETRLVNMVTIGATDHELSRLMALKIMPVTAEINGQPVTFSVDLQDEIYVATVPWCGTQVRVFLEAYDSRKTPAYIEEAQALFRDAPAWEAKLRDAAVSLVDEINREFTDPENQIKPAEAILARLRLNNIQILMDGDFEFNYEASAMLAGTELCISGNLKNGLDKPLLY